MFEKSLGVVVGGAVIGAMTLGALAAPSATLLIRYAGSTTGTLTAGQVRSGNGQTLPTTASTTGAVISSGSVALPADRTGTAWKHYFDLGLIFNTDGSDSAFRGLTFDVNLVGAGAAYVTPAGASGTGDPKYFGFNLLSDNAQASVMELNADFGTIGDMKQMTWLSSNGEAAYDTKIGTTEGAGTINGLPVESPTWIGRFGMRVNTGLAQPVTITPHLTTFGYFNNSATYGAVLTGEGVTVESFSVSVVPEAGTLGVLGVGVLGLVGRRRGK